MARAPKGPEEFFMRFHFREKAYSLDEQEIRQRVLVQALEHMALLLQYFGYEPYLEDKDGKVHKAVAYIRKLLGSSSTSSSAGQDKPELEEKG